jgi:hypothetical protein
MKYIFKYYPKEIEKENQFKQIFHSYEIHEVRTKEYLNFDHCIASHRDALLHSVVDLSYDSAPTRLVLIFLNFYMKSFVKIAF